MKQPLNQSFLAANNADASLKRVSLNIKQPPKLCIYTMELLLNANALRAVQQRMRISEDNLMAEDKNVECRFLECDDCILDGTDALCDMAFKLGLACHRLVQSIPIINPLASSKQCEWSTKE